MTRLSAFAGILALLFTTIANAENLVQLPPGPIQSPLDPAAARRLDRGSDGKTPTVKNFPPGWIEGLGARGEPMVYTKDNSKNFAYIGMPIGGIGAGELYLSGDGKLWLWDIFNTWTGDGFGIESGHSYIAPHEPGKPDNFVDVLDQGFVLQTTTSDGKTTARTIDKDGFADVKFRGQYPIGYVDYNDPACPVQVSLEAFSPFIPGNVADSSYPATILNYTLTNTSTQPVDCVIGGWVENGASMRARKDTKIQLENKVVSTPNYVAVNCSADQVMTGVQPPQVFEDFESGTYDGWTVTGTAFGDGPVKVGSVAGSISTPPDCQGQYYIDTYLHDSNDPQGTLTSKPFVITRPYIRFLVGGGGGSTQSVNLLVDNAAVRSTPGRGTRRMRPHFWDVHDLMGKTAQIQVSDAGSGGWAFIQADFFRFADTARDLSEESDSGTMTLALLGDPTGTEGIADANPSLSGSGKPDKTSKTILLTGAAKSAQGNISDRSPTMQGARPGQATAGLKTDYLQNNNPRLVGGIRHTMILQPGQKVTLHYVLSWCFPHPTGMPTEPSSARAYGTRFKSSQDVVDHLATDFDRLTKTTELWHDTWYDSTLPWWFLNRTFLNVSTLASSTDFLLGDDQFYGNEGGYSCPGTCTHVYSYQQVLDFVFPELEKSLQEQVEFNSGPGGGLQDDGGIHMRGNGGGPATDGQAGIILRAYLVHRMSPDDSYLMKNWDSIKKAMNYLIANNDADHDGILEGAQPNTLDSAWYGKVAWLSLYYQAALRATAEMADEMKDADHAKELRGLADSGRAYIEQKLYDGEYFVEDVNDPKHQDSPGSYTGCEIDQLMGQAWAYHDGLGQIVDPAKASSALDSIWKYNFTTDVGPYLRAFPKPKAREFALPGEPGTLMCTFPKGVVDNALSKGYPGYFNECWAGSEHLLASLMIWQGLVDKGLAVEKAVDDRYSDAAKRNPWDEVECGSHYSRSMSSYGVFTAAEGFTYHGPKGELGFAPRVTPNDFKGAFTAAEGWGSFSQKKSPDGYSAAIDLKYGKLRLTKLALATAVPAGKTVAVTLDGQSVTAKAATRNGQLVLSFAPDADLHAGQKLEIRAQ